MNSFKGGRGEQFPLLHSLKDTLVRLLIDDVIKLAHFLVCGRLTPGKLLPSPQEAVADHTWVHSNKAWHVLICVVYNNKQVG